MSKRTLRQQQHFEEEHPTYVPPTSDEEYMTSEKEDTSSDEEDTSSDKEDTTSDEEFTGEETKRPRKDRSPSIPTTSFDVLLAESRTLWKKKNRLYRPSVNRMMMNR